MSAEPFLREDNRLDQMPMAPVTCRNCGARVLARKSSWNQTSVQWDAGASARCIERRDADRLAGHHRGPFLACDALRESIQFAVATGELAIVDA
ncbi:ferredoxin [Mycobacterium sp. 1165196.3]|uniref:ferredoxin n=1 Tax=unclassified Mycobacterium TaxID=2642494 RepID=UPI0008004AEE|nr:MULTISPECIES: ferredoxin [unclassified Mycobacterium]OBJ26833.1 ferredoxin [Mycobacterium sp. 1245801.1]OBK34153.1 ferredoxin [Mycobacterium sp. 1165196.3]OBL09665.1 ferredoxin [Mycobacterium sp. 1245499.0]